MTNTDINIRITKDTHRTLKIKAAKYGITVKELIGLLALSKIPFKAEI